MYIDSKTAQELDKKLKILNQARPLSAEVIQKIQEQLQLEMNYNSNAIEGNTITLKETFWVVSEGLTVKGKSLKEHLEIKNQQEAIELIYEIVGQQKEKGISESLIKQLHHLVVKNTHEKTAGQYRDGSVRISGSDHQPPEAFEVSMKMNDLMKWFKKNKKKLHPIELAARFHHQLVHIHPFWDGNGRTARLAMNVLIMQAGYPLSIILKNDRKKYYRALSEADKGVYNRIINLVSQAVLRSLNIYIKYTLPQTQYSEKFLPLIELASKTPYSATYLRKLINLNQLEGFKEGRNWLSSKQAVEKYRARRQRKRN